VVNFSSSFLGLITRLPVNAYEFHPVNRVEQVLIAYRNLKALQGVLLIAMPRNHVRYRRVDPATHRVGIPAVPKVVQGGAGISLNAFNCLTPRSGKGLLSKRTVQQLSLIAGLPATLLDLTGTTDSGIVTFGLVPSRGSGRRLLAEETVGRSALVASNSTG
jgi:hypothetical protein